MAKAGFGGYINACSGASNKYFGGIPSINAFGGGFLFDTNIDEKGFNYRLNLGVDRYLERFNYSDIEHDRITDIVMLDFHNKAHRFLIPRIQIINNFGFGLISSSDLRLWLGPQLGVGAGFRNNLRLLSFSCGPVLGINYHINESISISLDGSLAFSLLMRKISYYHFSPLEYGFYDPSIYYGVINNPLAYKIATTSKCVYSYNIGYTGNINFSIIYKFGT